MKRAQIGLTCMALLLGCVASRADDDAMPLIDVTGAEAQRVIELLQEELSYVNPDAILEWCPLVLRAVTDRAGASPERIGAACRVQDGVVERRALLCADVLHHRFVWQSRDEDDRVALTRFIETACPDVISPP